MGFLPPPPWITPPPPRILYQYGKNSPSIWDSSPPPPKKIAHAVPILHMEFVLGGDLPKRGKVCHMVLFPSGEVLLWDFFWGKVCHMVFLQGERLLYGIISGGRGGGGGLGGRIPVSACRMIQYGSIEG